MTIWLGWLREGTAHTEEMHVEERFHRRDYGHLAMIVNVADPKPYPIDEKAPDQKEPWARK